MSDEEALSVGHVSYAVAFSKWGQGYGTAMLKFALYKGKEQGLKEVKILCNKNNSASIRVIEKNNGKFLFENAEENTYVYQVTL